MPLREAVGTGAGGHSLHLVIEEGLFLLFSPKISFKLDKWCIDFLEYSVWK